MRPDIVTARPWQHVSLKYRSHFSFAFRFNVIDDNPVGSLLAQDQQLDFFGGLLPISRIDKSHGGIGITTAIFPLPSSKSLHTNIKVSLKWKIDEGSHPAPPTEIDDPQMGTYNVNINNLFLSS